MRPITSFVLGLLFVLKLTSRTVKATGVRGRVQSDRSSSCPDAGCSSNACVRTLPALILLHRRGADQFAPRGGPAARANPAGLVVDRLAARRSVPVRRSVIGGRPGGLRRSGPRRSGANGCRRRRRGVPTCRRGLLTIGASTPPATLLPGAAAPARYRDPVRGGPEPTASSSVRAGTESCDCPSAGRVRSRRDAVRGPTLGQR